MTRTLARDRAAYSQFGGWLGSLGFWVGATYRLGAWARGLPLPFRGPLQIVYWFARLPWRLFLHVELPAGARIGAGLFLPHPHDILVGEGVEIGEGCSIFHEVTIGAGPRPGLPRIGDRVVLFVGSRVLGGVAIGDRAEIGANCVVTADVLPDNMIAPAPNRPIPIALLRRPVQGPATAEVGSLQPAEPAHDGDVLTGATSCTRSAPYAVRTPGSTRT